MVQKVSSTSQSRQNLAQFYSLSQSGDGKQHMPGPGMNYSIDNKLELSLGALPYVYLFCFPLDTQSKLLNSQCVVGSYRDTIYANICRKTYIEQNMRTI